MNKYKNPVTLPPYKILHVVSTLSQTTDWGLLNLNVPSTWTVTAGKGIVVLIIDTGCPATRSNGEIIVHPDLQGNIDIGKCKSFISDEGIEDLQGHGCHCCGIVAAKNNAIGCVGYAPEATIVTYKGLDKNGSGSMDQITAALDYAADILKPDLISMSLGSTVPDAKMHQAIKRLYDMNIPVVAAGGNGGAAEGVNYPGNYDEVLTIGAYDKKNNIADFSAVGEGIDFAFPGVEIYSTYLNGSYAKLSGTCLSGSTKVYTTKGPKYITDIQKGDLVYTLDEKKSKITSNPVINVLCNGNKQTYRLKTRHETIDATENHPFLIIDKKIKERGILRKYYDYSLQWKELKDLKIGDEIITPNAFNSGTENIEDIQTLLNDIHKTLKEKLTTAAPDTPIQFTYAFCQFIGAYLGDGFMYHDKRALNKRAGIGLCIRQGFKQLNKQLPEQYNNIFKEAFGEYVTRIQDGDLFKYSQYIANVFSELGLDEKAHTKRIPEWCFNLPDSYKFSILAGLIDSDGWITKTGNLGIQLCNLNLIDDIRQLCHSLGIIFSNTSHIRGVTNFSNDKICNSYVINSTKLKDFIDKIPILDECYKQHIQNRKQVWKKRNLKYTSQTLKQLYGLYKVEKIKEITPNIIEPVYDLTIQDNHNFIANGIIVHNSMATPAAAGIVALLLAKHKKQEAETGKNDCKTVEQIKEHFRKYAVDVGPTGKDKWYGYGIIDISKMIMTPENITPTTPTAAPTPPVVKPKKSIWRRFLDWWRE
jgi:major intracellular serine protease